MSAETVSKISADDRDYAAVVVRKQLTEDVNPEHVLEALGDEVAQLVAAGRAGDLDQVKQILRIS